MCGVGTGLLRGSIVSLVAGAALVLGGNACRAGELAGCWQGRWESCASGHDGKLRATIAKLGGDRYCAEFTGTFWYVFPFRYQVGLDAVEQGDAILLRGASDLGLLGGTFSYAATVTGTSFHATYSSCNDHGIFRMQRCDEPQCCCN